MLKDSTPLMEGQISSIPTALLHGPLNPSFFISKLHVVELLKHEDWNRWSLCWRKPWECTGFHWEKSMGARQLRSMKMALYQFEWNMTSCINQAWKHQHRSLASTKDLQAISELREIPHLYYYIALIRQSQPPQL